MNDRYRHVGHVLKSLYMHCVAFPSLGDIPQSPFWYEFQIGHPSQVPLKSYHAWALTDSFEWVDGYSKHFGVVHVDFATQKRTPRASARFLANLFGD